MNVILATELGLLNKMSNIINKLKYGLKKRPNLKAFDRFLLPNL